MNFINWKLIRTEVLSSPLALNEHLQRAEFKADLIIMSYFERYAGIWSSIRCATDVKAFRLVPSALIHVFLLFLIDRLNQTRHYIEVIV
jgi:hypothetical protein